jgi:hypothetical protein
MVPGPPELFFEVEVGSRRREDRVEGFKRIEALVDSAAAGDITEADALLRRFKARSHTLAEAIDEFMLDFKTLVFVVEIGGDGLEKPIRAMARDKLSTIRQLVSVAA